MPRNLTQSSIMRPFVALALPGMYLVYKYHQYRRQQQENSRRRAAERELMSLHHKIDKLLNKLDEHEPELAMCQEEECVICVNAKATMQTFPCGHRVVCRKCFVKTIQVAVSQRLLPLRCVVCRAKILRLRQSRDPTFPTSVSQYSMSSRCTMPNSSSLHSFASGSSGISGVSNVSSASSSSGGSYQSIGRGKVIRHGNIYASKRLPQQKKVRYMVSSKSGARSKEPLKGLPQIRIDEYQEPPCRPPPLPRPPRVLMRENKVAPQLNNSMYIQIEELGRLPTIKEYTEFITEKEMEREKSSSTRIRCAQKLVSQIEHHQPRIGSPRPPVTPIPLRSPLSLSPTRPISPNEASVSGIQVAGQRSPGHQNPRSPVLQVTGSGQYPRSPQDISRSPILQVISSGQHPRSLQENSRSPILQVITSGQHPRSPQDNSRSPILQVITSGQHPRSPQDNSRSPILQVITSGHHPRSPQEISRSPSLQVTGSGQNSRSPSISPSGHGRSRRESSASNASNASLHSLTSATSIKSGSTLSAASMKSAGSTKSTISAKSASSKSTVSVKSAISVKSACPKSTGKTQMAKTKTSNKKQDNKGVKRKDEAKSQTKTQSKTQNKTQVVTKDAKGKGKGESKNKSKEGKGEGKVKTESKIKALKKRFEGKEYQRLQ